MSLDPTLDPWQQQPGETAAVYSQFVVYRDLGTKRMLSTAQRITGKDNTRHSGAWSWAFRCKAWDRHIQSDKDEIILEGERAAQRAMVARHTDVSLMAQTFLTVQMRRWFNAAGTELDPKAKQDTNLMPVLSFDELRKGLEWAFSTERRNRGVPDVVSEVTVKGTEPATISALKGMPADAKAAFMDAIVKSRVAGGGDGDE